MGHVRHPPIFWAFTFPITIVIGNVECPWWLGMLREARTFRSILSDHFGHHYGGSLRMLREVGARTPLIPSDVPDEKK